MIKDTIFQKNTSKKVILSTNFFEKGEQYGTF
jgi:hypothetical protein